MLLEEDGCKSNEFIKEDADHCQRNKCHEKVHNGKCDVGIASSFI